MTAEDAKRLAEEASTAGLPPPQGVIYGNLGPEGELPPPPPPDSTDGGDDGDVYKMAEGEAPCAGVDPFGTEPPEIDFTEMEQPPMSSSAVERRKEERAAMAKRREEKAKKKLAIKAAEEKLKAKSIEKKAALKGEMCRIQSEMRAERKALGADFTGKPKVKPSFR